MAIAQQQLQQFLPNNSYITEWSNALNTYFPTYEINTTYRIAQFLAQTYVESEAYTALIENLNYSAQSRERLRYRQIFNLSENEIVTPEDLVNKFKIKRKKTYLQNGKEKRNN